MKNLFFLALILFAQSSWSYQNTPKDGGVWFALDQISEVPTADPKGGFKSQNLKLNELVKKFKITQVSNPFPSSRNPDLKKVIELRCSECDLNLLKKQLSEAGFGNSKRPVEIVPVYQGLIVPNDDGLASPNDYALKLIGAQCAWDITIGNPNVAVALSDLNFFADANNGGVHEELANKVVYYDPTNTASRAHGTMVSILAAGNTNNKVGNSSIGFNSSLALYGLHPDQVLKAAQAGHKIINMSWGTCSNSVYIQQVMTEAYNLGSFLVAAAGNGAVTCNAADALVYPAAMENVFSVTSIGPKDNHEKYPGYPFTTHQHNPKVDLSAPGYDVATSPKSGFYTTNDGTSLAAPIVSGTVALMLAVNPSLTNSEIEQILKSTAVPIDQLNPNYAGLIGAGRLNACAAVTAAKNKAGLKAFARIKNACYREKVIAFVDVVGGVRPYSFSWSNGSTSESLIGLAPGIYSVTVTDANGQKTTVSVNVPATMNFTGVITHSIDNLNNGAIQLSVTGQTPQSFLWKSASGFTASTKDISGLSPSSYTATVTSDQGCKLSKTFTVKKIIKADPRTNGISFDTAQ